MSDHEFNIPKGFAKLSGEEMHDLARGLLERLEAMDPSVRTSAFGILLLEAYGMGAAEQSERDLETIRGKETG